MLGVGCNQRSNFKNICLINVMKITLKYLIYAVALDQFYIRCEENHGIQKAKPTLSISVHSLGSKSGRRIGNNVKVAKI
ncbi:hypothetical protein AK823_02655 [Psychrobacter sp. P2G3]|nr:hypothetical protein AK823_02655 [Psychrobacter sp. P2G3]